MGLCASTDYLESQYEAEQAAAGARRRAAASSKVAPSPTQPPPQARVEPRVAVPPGPAGSPPRVASMPKMDRGQTPASSGSSGGPAAGMAARPTFKQQPPLRSASMPVARSTSPLSSPGSISPPISRRGSEAAMVSLSSLKAHSAAGDAWLAVGGRVYDVTAFLDKHPGGKSVIARNLGRDCTREFKDAHSHVRIDTAKHIRLVGTLAS